MCIQIITINNGPDDIHTKTFTIKKVIKFI